MSESGGFGLREDTGIDTCTTCPSLCRWACPVAEVEARETVSPHALVVLGGLMKRAIIPADSAGDLPFHCTHCGACTEACLHKNDVPFLLSFARSRVVANHSAPAKVNEIRGGYGIAGNPQGLALDGVLARVTEEADVSIAKSGKTVYFPGCETLAQMPEAASAFLRTTLLFGLSSHVSVTPTSASCCGAALLYAGDIEGFRHHATRFANQVRGIENLIVHDASCAFVFAKRYADFGVELAPKITHVADFLGERLDRSSAAGLELRPSGPVAYADSCNLARGMDCVEAPRQLLERATGRAPLEISHLNGREVDCCGASGLLPLTAPHAARAMAEARIQAFRGSGARELAMFSPRCAAHLKSVEPSLPVIDVTMLLSRL